MEHNRRRILFIDDDTEEVDVFRILLGPECEALHIDAPDQIERAMSEFLPDCVMIDHNLGTTTSLEVLAKLKAREYTGPVAFIILTGSNSLDLAVQCMRSGAHDFLVKGKLNRNEFNRAIERAMRNAELEFRIHRVAYYDTLTGALNRKSLWEKLEERLVRAEKTDNKFAVLNIDLDRFKYINDTFGHYFGDCVLSNVVSRTKTCLSSGDFIARTGGDEFLVLVNAGQSHSELLQLADRIRTGLTEPMKIDGKSVSVTPSVGIATYPDDGTTIDELINHSDVAMYAAKKDGKNRVRAFDEDLKSETDHRNMLEQALRQACDNEEFVVHYQPIVNELGEVVGLEALLRWQRPGQDLNFPAGFMDLLEESGQIIPVGHQVIELVCRQCRLWEDAGVRPTRVNINISPRQFQDPALDYTLKTIMARYKISPDWVGLEITESCMIADLDECIQVLARWRSNGIHVSLDDFGSGYSSLGYLKHLPLDTLKIDRGFTNGLPEDAGDIGIVTAILALAENLGLRVIAEGVESDEQLRALREYGCRYFQGYKFSKPLPAEQIAGYVKQAGRVP